MSRLDKLKERHNQQASKLGMNTSTEDTPDITATNAIKDSQKKSSNFNIKSLFKGIKFYVSLLIVILIVTSIYFLINSRVSFDDYEKAVGVVVISGSVEQIFSEAFSSDEYLSDDGSSSANQVHFPFASAFAISDNEFVSSAHVTKEIESLLNRGYELYIKLSKTENINYPIVKVSHHPNYDENRLNYFDVGLIEVSEKIPYKLKIASKKELYNLSNGDNVCYIGFPLSNQVKGGINLSSPVPTLQKGNITSISDFDYKSIDKKFNYLIRHNLGAAGGASGSPLLNKKGKVVGILSAITIDAPNRELSAQDTENSFNPSAVMINFAQRADLIKQVRKGNNFFD